MLKNEYYGVSCSKMNIIVYHVEGWMNMTGKAYIPMWMLKIYYWWNHNNEITPAILTAGRINQNNVNPQNMHMILALLFCCGWVLNDFIHTIRVTLLEPGPRLNIKTVLSTYGDFHVKDKTAVRTSYL